MTEPNGNQCPSDRISCTMDWSYIQIVRHSQARPAKAPMAEPWKTRPRGLFREQHRGHDLLAHEKAVVFLGLLFLTRPTSRLGNNRQKSYQRGNCATGSRGSCGLMASSYRDEKIACASRGDLEKINSVFSRREYSVPSALANLIWKNERERRKARI